MEYIISKRHYILALAIMFVVVSLSDTTYSLFLKEDSTKDFTYNTGTLDLQFVEDEQISLQNALPIIDSEGMKNEPYTLTIKNTGTLPYLFDLKMLSGTEENTIDTKYIKYQVNEEKQNTLYQTNNVIATNVILYPNEEKTFNIKIWLDINTPNAQLGKVFVAKLATTGQSVYRTMDTSGANRPNLIDGMIPVYYDEGSQTWKKADKSNSTEANYWYNYDNKEWANAIILKNSEKQIFDITRKNNLKLDEARTNNGNYITDEKYLDINLSNINYTNISNVFRIKFNDITPDNIYILSNGKMSYYYNTTNNKFIFEIDNKVVESNQYKIEKGTWYILGYTYSNNKLSFYINGTNLSTHNISGTLTTRNTLKIGTDKTFKELSNIEIGDIYIYNDILTEEEIKNNYNTTINIIYDSLVVGYNDFEPKTIKEYYLSQNLGTSIKNEDILQLYVWIPRYKYKLWNVTGTNGIDNYDAYKKGIDIVFEKNTESSGVIKCEKLICYSDDLMITKVTKNDNGKYYTHPAFSTKEKELTGIWVSKYEISTSSTSCTQENQNGCLANDLEVESKQGNIAWRNNYLSYFYQNIKKMDENNNYNIIKNSEWGAITYLTHSKYGICNNNQCTELVANKTYISGNELKDSTTGNIYGVFDMAGSATEFVISNYSSDGKNLNLLNTHFGETILDKDDYELYYDNYFILGDATKELALSNGNWYNNHSTFIEDTNNWFIRGGIGPTNNSGIFYYNATTDIANEYITTRIILKNN